MKQVCKEIFIAVHEGRWLSIEYNNKKGDTTKYWIGIKKINIAKRSLLVDGLHVMNHSIMELYIHIDSISSADVIDGTYYPINKDLVDDIAINPDKYRDIFDNIANMKILDYLESCQKLDSCPYTAEYSLISNLDNDRLISNDEYLLTDEQYGELISNCNSGKKKKNQKKTVHLAINLLSIHSKKGLYVLAYRRLLFDVINHKLVPDEEIVICTEYQVDGEYHETIRKYLDADEYSLLDDYEKNQEIIKNAIQRKYPHKPVVDDMPYIIAIGRKLVVDLVSEYNAISDMYAEGNITIPMRAFFGDLLDKPRRRKAYSIALINNKINIDQLLAINKALQYPTAYIQGPPGTGKTNTIINTIISAFFNERTVLFSSYNNHPIDEVFEKIISLKYNNNTIPFPVLRLGNYEMVKNSIGYIRRMYEYTSRINVYESSLDKRKDNRKERAKLLSERLKDYEEYLDLVEKKEAVNVVLEKNNDGVGSSTLMPFNFDLKYRQLKQIEDEISNINVITEDEAMTLLDRNEDEFLGYLYYSSAKYIKRLREPKYDKLRGILYLDNLDDATKEFSKYLSESENVHDLLRIFPVIITTCISAHKLGKPEPQFDMTIIDEAGQCNTAVSLMPIIRGENLMLVGDPQQLKPVILLNETTNKILRKKYNISDEYDYIKNSIYKVFLASDSVSDEILLRDHYRCSPKIIGFNNKKYYNSKLKVNSIEKDSKPLVFVDIKAKGGEVKNTSEEEANIIVEYARTNKDKSIGVITPFVNQKETISRRLEMAGLSKNVACGTVHSFQGDEKDIIIFSAAINDDTHEKTYSWLADNNELINVATSRPKEKLIVLADMKNVERLHKDKENDDFYELVQYVKKEGDTVITTKETQSRALGVKPFSSEIENAFLVNLSHALDNIWLKKSKYVVHKEVAVSQVFDNNISYDYLFYSGRFDFVVYEKNKEKEIPVLAIELDGKEHLMDEAVIERDKHKNAICKQHNLQLIRVENSYARRYNYIKDILESYFSYRR